MKFPLARAAGLAAVAALAVPASALAHGSVFTTTAKVVTDPSNPAVTGNQTHYVVTNHGFTFVLREDNFDTDKGMINYKVLPGAYRNRPGFTQADKLSEGDTGAQPHGVCRNAPALSSEEAILEWQTGGDHGNDPFYGYVPFQATSAGLEDDPDSWLPVVLARTGIDLRTVTNPFIACQSIGGTYSPADGIVTTARALSSGPIAEAVDPLEEQIETLGTALAEARQTKAAADAALDEVRTTLAGSLLANTRLRLTLDPARFGAGDGTTLRIAGPALQPVSIRMLLTRARADALGLKSRVLATATAVVGIDATTELKLQPKASVASALRKLRGPTGVTFDAVSGDRQAVTTGLMSR